jgi:hypothetical protein
MPKTDYSDPETEFPRLQARIQKTEEDAFWIQIWLWEKAGDEGNRREIMNGKRAGSFADITEMVYESARELDVIVEPDDIIVNDH